MEAHRKFFLGYACLLPCLPEHNTDFEFFISRVKGLCKFR